MNKINFNLVFKDDGTITLENPQTGKEHLIADDIDSFFHHPSTSYVGNNFVEVFQPIVKNEKYNSFKDKYPEGKLQPKNKKELEEFIDYLIDSSEEDIVDLNSIDTSLITDMSGLFSKAGGTYGLAAFNPRSDKNIDISKWDVSNVTNMAGIFTNNRGFNGDLSNWDVSKVERMDSMFAGSSFNNDSLKNWDVSNVEDFEEMFAGSKFNGDLSGWRLGTNIPYNTGSFITGTYGMFKNCPFHGDISHWFDDFPRGKYYGSVRGMFKGSAFGEEDDLNNTIPNWYYRLTRRKKPSKELAESKTNKFIRKIQERNQFSADLKKLNLF